MFVIIALGASVVTLNAQLLGARISFFQALCCLGYCMLPLVGACIMLKSVGYLMSGTHVAVRIVVLVAALAWTIVAGSGFLGSVDDR